MLRALMLALIRLYRRGLSPALPPTCRFTPSCSEYAETAIERHGAGRGGWLALRRLLRCHPLGGRGYDPVPERAHAAPERSPGSDRAPADTLLD